MSWRFVPNRRRAAADLIRRDLAVLEEAGYRCQLRLPRCQGTATRVHHEAGTNAAERPQAACARCSGTLSVLAEAIASACDPRVLDSEFPPTTDAAVRERAPAFRGRGPLR
jgi:transposase